MGAYPSTGCKYGVAGPMRTPAGYANLWISPIAVNGVNWGLVFEPKTNKELKQIATSADNLPISNLINGYDNAISGNNGTNKDILSGLGGPSRGFMVEAKYINGKFDFSDYNISAILYNHGTNNYYLYNIDQALIQYTDRVLQGSNPIKALDNYYYSRAAQNYNFLRLIAKYSISFKGGAPKFDRYGQVTNLQVFLIFTETGGWPMEHLATYHTAAKRNDDGSATRYLVHPMVGKFRYLSARRKAVLVRPLIALAAWIPLPGAEDCPDERQWKYNSDSEKRNADIRRQANQTLPADYFGKSNNNGYLTAFILIIVLICFFIFYKKQINKTFFGKKR
jgi:hypothetical protein